ncbi:MAG TPA: GAF domain-containing protein [Candidatus Limnocylindria bacterium]|jgi:GAF domain-containing protein|nr:GAF domain-containing protein [Candidatus Limnocylindria bacterium]
MRAPVQTTTGLAAVLRGVVADMQHASKADIVSVFLYEESTHTYYAPFATGQPQESLLDSLTDMREQLARYSADLNQGKVPDDFAVHQYGSTVWLTVMRQKLVARDAPSEIDSTFIRRYQVQATIGLPLLVGERLLGIVYLNYRGRDQAPDGARLAELERRAAGAATAIASVLAAAERSALDGIGRLAALLTASVDDERADIKELRRHLSIALAELLLASELDAAAIYQFASQRTSLELVTAHAPVAAPPRIDRSDPGAPWPSVLTETVAAVTSSADLHPVATYALGSEQEPHGYLVVLSRDRLATVRRAPATDLLLKAGAELIGSSLASQRLITDLEKSNRLLGALGDMTTAMLKPGASRQEVLEAVTGHLTDATVPEFDFHFASVYLLDERAGETIVSAAAGAATTAAIDSAETSKGGARRARVPRWVLEEERVLAPDDVLVHVARTWQVAVVGPLPAGGATDRADVVTGALPALSAWADVPVVRSDGTILGHVAACLIGGGPEAHQPGTGQPPFTLAGEVFEKSGHADLIRIFLPFGSDLNSRATGVLEVGYHRSHDRRPDWGQIEALRAAAAQVAVAVETARLYEEARRHGEELELSADVSRAIASSIDLDQTLRLVAQGLVRLVDASLCQIALYEEDREGWFGAAASDQEDLWRRQHGERSEPSFLFQVLDRGEPLVVEDTSSSDIVSASYVKAFGARSLLALPLVADGQTIGAAVLAERDHLRTFTPEEVERVQGLALGAAVAIKNARLHALAEEERHLQKDFVLVGFGQWGQKAYQHLQTLKQFFNFRIHVVEQDSPGARERLAAREEEVKTHGDAFYWDGPTLPAHDQLQRELESSSYVITYIATPASTHLPTLALYYDLSDVVLIEKPLGAPPDEYREFLDSAPGGVEIVAADHYYFKLEVRLLQLLLTEERTLRDFLDNVEEIRIEILEEQPLVGAAADIGVIADLIPHAFAIISLLTPIDRIHLDAEAPLLVGRHEGLTGQRESYARMNASFQNRGRTVRLVIDVGKGAENAKWIKLSGERRAGGRSPSYKFDFGKGEAIDGTQATVRAAVRRIREPGVPDNAHLNMLRHVIEKRHPAVGILSIREAIRANQRVRDLEAMAVDLLARGEVTSYALGTRPAFDTKRPVPTPVASQPTH